MPFAVETGDRKVELMKKEQMLYNKMQMGKGTGKRMKFGKLKDLSIKKKILLGYLLIICITVIFMLLLLGTLWEHLTKESISKSI